MSRWKCLHFVGTMVSGGRVMVSVQIENMRKHRIDTGRITLNVYEAGKGPVAIFLHGITSNGAVWEPVIATLKNSMRCIGVDQRGHGLSDKPTNGYRAVDYSEDALALIKALNSGPAVIVGHSLGARNGVVAATLRPDLVTAVVAIDFTPYIEVEVLDALETRVNAGDRIFPSREEIEDYLRSRYPMMPTEAIRRRAYSAYEEVPGGLRPLASPEAMAQTAAGLREDLEPAFKAVDRPVLMIRGAVSKLVSASALEKTRKLRPDLPALVVENTDHYVNEEEPEIVSKAILDFLAKVH